MIINGKEIKALAEYAGFKVESDGIDNESLYEAEYTLAHGLNIYDEEDGTSKKYSISVQCDGCEHNEWNPLSDR
ncbi:hypothetical protein [Agarilytica rhodophyticola]|uniref:hypothetical protein n=1 Tax=Agarilytica rhodophyticola TaxID=1737490 RepID=UPI000B341BBC|nr:hypothetical protein [Agarilytica rhodophyticola]